MQELIQLVSGWIHNPGFVALATLLASACVDSMPAPIASSSRFYLWFFGVAHAVMLHADKFKLDIPPAPPANPPGQTGK